MVENTLAHPELAAFEVHGMTRASFMLRGALAAGAVYGTTAVGPFVAQALAQTGGGDAEILNFALTSGVPRVRLLHHEGKRSGTQRSGQDLCQGIRHGGGATRRGADGRHQGTRREAGQVAHIRFPGNQRKELSCLASVLENTGVGAYNGAAPSLKSKQLLGVAGSIVQVEARHAAAIDLLVNRSPTPNGGFDLPLTKQQVLAKAGPLIKS